MTEHAGTEHGRAGAAAPGGARLWVYMTAGDWEEARRIGARLVEERLAACVNLLPGMVSLYRWEGAVEEGREVVMIAKTTQNHRADLTARVADLHSYDCPCVVALPMTGGHAPFLDWIGGETA